MHGHNTATCKLPITAQSDSTSLNQLALVDSTPYSYKALAPPKSSNTGWFYTFKLGRSTFPNHTTPSDFAPQSQPLPKKKKRLQKGSKPVLSQP